MTSKISSCSTILSELEGYDASEEQRTAVAEATASCGSIDDIDIFIGTKIGEIDGYISEVSGTIQSTTESQVATLSTQNTQCAGFLSEIESFIGGDERDDFAE